MAGRFLKSFALTMAIAVAVSMLVAFSLTPALAAQWLRRREPGQEASGLERFVDRFYKPVERVYVAMLRWCLGHRWVVVLACIASLASTVPVSKKLAMSFMPQDDAAQFEVNVKAPEGMSLPATRLICERIAADIGQIPQITRTLLTVGEGTYEASNEGKVYVFLTAPDRRRVTQAELMDKVRKDVLSKLSPDLRVSVEEVMSISIGRSATIQLALQGPDLKQLTAYAKNITRALKEIPGALDVDSSLSEGKPELRVSIDRERAASLGVQVADVADTMQLFVGGLKASSYAEAGEQYDIRVRADARYRADAASLGQLAVPSSKYGSVPVSNLVTTHNDSGPSSIDRLDRRRQITIMANASPTVGESSVQSALQDIVKRQNLASGYTTQLMGRSKETSRMVAGFLMVIGMAVVLVYLVLAAQFESWLHPITILLSLPLTVPFALISLFLFQDSLNMFSALGLLVLFGVVKKNAILQIDHTNQLRTSGLARLEAMLQANKDRLRPILMTTLAFVAGMIPLVFSQGIGAGKNRTMGAIVLGGQSLSLLLTLLAVPVAYSLLDDTSAWFARWRKKRDRGEQELEAMLHVASVPKHTEGMSEQLS
jgi:multidrug efflux pump subunit AcrB